MKPELVPISRATADTGLLKPVTIEMLQEIYKCELVTLAAHTHTHKEVNSLSNAELSDEIIKSDKFFKKYLNFIPQHFAYPRGAWNEAAEKMLSERYETIALVGGGGVQPNLFNELRIPRVPILRSDGMFWFKHRIAGRLKLEEKLTAILTGRKSSY